VKPKLFSLLLLAALGAASFQARAVGALADVSVIDRQSGATLPLHHHRGEYWVAGRPGAAYAISVRNRLGERIMAVTSVDGVNVLSGETAGWDQNGYVFGPSRSYQITGWRKSDSEVAAFEFSAASGSYASRTGRPGQVGVIGVALFKEQRPEPILLPAPDYSRGNDYRSDRSNRSESSSLHEKSAAPAAPAPSDTARGTGEAQALAQPDSGSLTLPRQRAEKLGTAHGARETSIVSQTQFVRLQAQPNEIIRIRYDSRERLIAAGVIREPVHNLPSPNPFPESARASYVPDPPPLRY
jgi:hypothetical protein